VAYNVEFVPKYCCACSKAMQVHSVFVVRPGMLECIVKLGRYSEWYVVSGSEGVLVGKGKIDE